MGGNPLKWDMGRFVPVARTLRIAFLVSGMIYELKNTFKSFELTRDVNEKIASQFIVRKGFTIEKLILLDRVYPAKVVRSLLFTHYCS